MLECLIPCPIENIHLVQPAIEALKRCTDVPFRPIVVIDGGTRSDYEREVEVGATKFIHNPKRVYLNQCILQGIAELEEQFVALVPPETVIDDPKWFGKMQQVFLKDPHAFVCYGIPDTQAATAPPVRIPQAAKFDIKHRFALLLTRELKLLGTSTGKEEPVEFWVKSTFRRGGTVWCSPGVRYTITEHKEHDTWREKSAAPGASKSR